MIAIYSPVVVVYALLDGQTFVQGVEVALLGPAVHRLADLGLLEHVVHLR
jgi:hypothetical protein